MVSFFLVPLPDFLRKNYIIIHISRSLSVMVVYLKWLIHSAPAARENGACQSDGPICFTLLMSAGGARGAQDVCQVWQSLWPDEWKGGLGWRAASVGVGSGDEPAINQLLSARWVQILLHCCSFHSHDDVFAKGDRASNSRTQGHCLSRGVWWKNFGGEKKKLQYFVVRVCSRAILIKGLIK